MEKTVTLKVGMTCGGCKSAVTKVLSKLDGVNDGKNTFFKLVSLPITTTFLYLKYYYSFFQLMQI